MLKMNIRNKFLIPTILLIIVGMGVSTTISYVKSKQALSTALLHNSDQRAESAAASLHAWIKDRKLDVKSWSHEEVYAKATKDSIIGKAARAAANKKLARLKADYGYYEDFLLASADGTVIASNREAAIGKINVKDRPYFQAALQGQLFTSDVAVSRASGHPVFFVAAPLTDNGHVSGVLAGVVSITSFSEQFIDPIKIGKSGYAYVVNKTGLIIAHNDKSKIMKESFGDQEWGKEMLAQKNGHINYVYEGVKKTVAFNAVEGQEWIVAVTAPHAEILGPVRSLGRINLLVAVAVIAVAMALIFIITGTVVNPVNRVVAGLKDAAEGEGDLTKRIDISSSDEVGELARWFNQFVEKVQIIIRDVAGNAGHLGTASANLSEISRAMNEGADSASAKTQSVAGASEEMSANSASIAAALEQAATNIQMVSSAAEEMTATINEIASNSEKGRSITSDAVNQTEEASRQVSELGKAAEDIGKVVETITDISEQVNLLALNATIEAARAGEAGKGFAVVANEIKELAKQTAAATGEIKNKVAGIQTSTDGTIAQIGSISQVVNGVNEIVSTIATAVEEQSVTTREIAENISQAATGIGEVNENVAQNNQVVEQISAEIADVNHTSGEFSNSSAQVNMSASELSEYADTLNTLVGKFVV